VRTLLTSPEFLNSLKDKDVQDLAYKIFDHITDQSFFVDDKLIARVGTQFWTHLMVKDLNLAPKILASQAFKEMITDEQLDKFIFDNILPKKDHTALN
jgi:hypothetical protein